MFTVTTTWRDPNENATNPKISSLTKAEKGNADALTSLSAISISESRKKKKNSIQLYESINFPFCFSLNSDILITLRL